MGFKNTLKGLVGSKNISRVRFVKGHMKYIKSHFLENEKNISVNEKEWKNITIFSKPRKHLFFGYYDIQQVNADQDKLLITEIPVKADSRRDKALLQWVDFKGKNYHDIAETKAWCWQQGARLRWHPTMHNWVLFNDVEQDQYVTRMVDITNNQMVHVYPRALYDVTPDGKIGLSLNFARLQRLRPGYGYNAISDETLPEKVPTEDGIFLLDLETDEVRLIVSMEQLVALTPGSENEWNYINHISISPDGKKFIFFHLWTPAVGARWKNKLYTANIDGSDLTCIEQEYITSHYCWKDPNTLLTTSVGFGGSESYYFLYDLNTLKRVTIESDNLHRDGHPGFCNDKRHFVTDTYPQGNCMQYLFRESIEGTDYSEICRLYSDPRLFDEKRCDMHPRLTPDNKYITVDTTFMGGKRSVVLLENKYSMGNSEMII